MYEYVQEVREWNRHPVSQACKRFLEQADPPADPVEEELYLLQLLHWGLAEGKVRLRHPSDPRPEAHLEEYVASLYLEHPDNVMKPLLEQGVSPEEPWMSLEELRSQPTPEAAAQYLAEALQNALEELTPPPRLEGD